MIIKKNYNSKIPIILLVIFTELIIGGLGRLFYFPLRISLFIFAFIYALLYAYKKKIVIPRYIILGILSLFLYCLSGVLIGVFRGNSLNISLKDITNFISILYVIVFIICINYDRNILYKLIKLFRLYVFCLSIVTISIFIWSYFAKYLGIDAIQTLVNFKEKTNYGFITGWLYDMKFARVYFANGIYMQISLSLVISDILKFKEKKYYIEAMILMLAIFSSGTRGYWLGSFLVIVMHFIIAKNINKFKLIKIGITILLILIPLLIIVPEKELILDRLFSITDFENDISNNIRSIQIECLNEEIKKHPIIGGGFGSSLTNYEKITGRDGLNVEVYYLELLYKTGIIGIIVILYLLLTIFIKTYRLILNNYLYDDDKQLLNAWMISVISVIIVGISNPYMKGAFGVFILDMLIIMNIVFEFNINKNNYIKKEKI